MRTVEPLIRLVISIITVIGLAACDGSLPATSPLAAGNAKNAICAQVLAGAPLTADQLARMIEVRQKFFGAANVDALTGAVRSDRVIASWVSVSGYALAINGHMVLLDAFVGNNSGSSYIPTDDCELSDLRPEYLFIGHGHGDHAQALASIVNRNRGTTVVGSGELCTDLKTSLASRFVPSCIEALPKSAPLASLQDIGALIPDVQITALRHPHSTQTAPQNPTSPSVVVPQPPYPKPAGAGPCVNCPALTSPNAVVQATNEDGAASLLYQFVLGDFVLTWNNTNGPNVPGDAVLSAMATLPQTDVELGSILGFNVFTNGFLDVRNIAEALRVRLLVPSHHDFIAPYQGRSYQASLNTEFAKTPEERRPGITFVTDPDDYLNHERLTWNPSAAIWKRTTPVTEESAKP